MTVPAVVPAEVPMLDLDRLDVYRAAVQFCGVVSRWRVAPAALRDQIDRASASVVLTLADLLHARGALTGSAHRDARLLLVRVVQMLTRLIDRQRSARAPRPVP